VTSSGICSFDVADEHWDHEAGWYDREVVPMLDLKSVLNSDKVILIDTGDIHGESSKMFTVLFLSHLWTSVRSIWTPNDDDYIANVIIEERRTSLAPKSSTKTSCRKAASSTSHLD